MVVTLRGWQVIWDDDTEQMGFGLIAVLVAVGTFGVTWLFSAHKTLPRVRFITLYHMAALLSYFAALATAVAAAIGRIICAGILVVVNFMRLGAGL